MCVCVCVCVCVCLCVCVCMCVCHKHSVYEKAIRTSIRCLAGLCAIMSPAKRLAVIPIHMYCTVPGYYIVWVMSVPQQRNSLSSLITRGQQQQVSPVQ